MADDAFPSMSDTPVEKVQSPGDDIDDENIENKDHDRFHFDGTSREAAKLIFCLQDVISRITTKSEAPQTGDVEYLAEYSRYAAASRGNWCEMLLLEYDQPLTINY